jgi:hypothetical protein
MVRRTSTQQLFDAPIPGQSLTKKLGSSPLESPPQYVDLDKAAEDIWTSIQSPESAIKIKTMLKAGAPAEAIAKSITQGGVLEGKWTPDLKMLLEPIVIAQVATVGELQDIPKENIKIFWEDESLPEFLARVGGPITSAPSMEELKVLGEQLERGEIEIEGLEPTPVPQEKPFRGILANDLGGPFTSAPSMEELEVLGEQLERGEIEIEGL